MSEALLTERVIAYARHLGLLVHHCKDSRFCRGTPGLPDLVIVGPSSLLFAELKERYRTTTADQDRWLLALHQLVVPYVVWKPQDWESGVIQARLTEMAVREVA